MKEYTDEIFEEPSQYGLRGDPYLWKDLKAKYQYSNVVEIDGFQKLLLDTFKENTGNLPVKGKNYFVEHFSFGGMSSGSVSSDFWIEIGFPLLEKRFKKIKNR